MELRGAVVEATYAALGGSPLKRLREERVPQLIEPQTLRFAGKRFLQVDQLRELPYSPGRQITSDDFSPADASSLAEGVLRFEQEQAAAAYIAPALPLLDGDLATWIRHNDSLLHAAATANGGHQVDRRPLIAHVAPGREAIANAKLIVNRLDYPIDAIYVEALLLNPTGDSADKLRRYVDFLEGLKTVGVPIVAGRVGAFGLVLQALGVSAFDSGLGTAEQSNLADLNRPKTATELARNPTGGSKRVYFEPLKTTLQGDHVSAIVSSTTLRGQVVCDRGCCRHRGFEDLPERARPHYL